MYQRNVTGLSIIALLLSLSILTMLASTAAPALASLYRKIELSSVTNSLFSLTQQARHHALSQQVRVSVCPLSAVGDCSKDWQQDISVFTDTNGNRRLDEGDVLLNTLSRSQRVQISWSGMGSGNSLHFNRQGVTFVSNGTFSLSNGDKKTQVAISRLGKPKIVTSKEPSIP